MRPSTPLLETARLILRPMEAGDADPIQARFPRWEIVRYLDSVVPWPYPSDGAATYLRDIVVPGMQRGTEWHWSIRRKQEPGELIGAIGLRDKAGDNRGFWLDPGWQGQGLMIEASDAVTEFWFETLGRPVLQVVKAVANQASRRISERAGMRVIEVMERDFVSGCQTAELWEITRTEWRSSRGG